MLHRKVASTVPGLLGGMMMLGGGASAMPAAPSPMPSPPPPAAIERVANGCGPGFFRTLAGQCFPNRRFVGPYGGIHAPPPCPPGYLRAPDRPLCYPVGR